MRGRSLLYLRVKNERTQFTILEKLRMRGRSLLYLRVKNERTQFTIIES